MLPVMGVMSARAAKRFVMSAAILLIGHGQDLVSGLCGCCVPFGLRRLLPLSASPLLPYGTAAQARLEYRLACA